MRILVTGGAGYIGSHTVRHLLANGHEVTVFDSLEYGHRQAVPAESLVVGNLRDIDHLDQLLVVNRIEAVVHFAAFAYVGESVTNPAKYYTNNLIYSLQLLDRCRRNGIQKFVFSSTCATYGVPDRVPITEEAPQAPVNPYGHTKLAFEHALSDYASAYPFGFCALRYFNAAGAAADGSIGEDHTPETHLIPLVFQAATGKIPHVTVLGTDYPTPDGTCVRDYVHVDDLATAHALALDKIAPGSKLAYNVGLGRGYSVREVIAAVEAVTGLKVPVKEGPRRAGDPPVLVANADKIRRELGWSAKYDSLRAILDTAWRWHQSHPNGFGE
ncbi:udp-glucose 4-epimerase : UDP-glucose 4-epimerase OS=Coraliomargarita akajimensis (strain DSM 45221 / IAM 15411 / JCM 23193 / KCTC 12865) GN=Caka_1849 PE=3 SV=1: Epimerase: Epimerase_Csub [Gemmata massiliana]|uniref:UDP-glucose 4-epimerase n=1 Tax=Gemmata massiliana TaxID=1210884 RepID=A0A6P2DEQ0_9BACT|nr:UDP-glucose 4-epimerase GalE [Gemmata massiliana]VTR99639.1 udp-glucose 4-epimerase : UDP-glucose 4-epimerase OS=Coraliomargarita akajimensis (strain DSM 45221 / IAM 15411 / JCM 23193 / KCTC 12865) GN=Caka_1849 PE=3 SV=1: Epimerase: Epimerase_Csub [Gemmata massiliana]